MTDLLEALWRISGRVAYLQQVLLLPATSARDEREQHECAAADSQQQRQCVAAIAEFGDVDAGRLADGDADRFRIFGD